jgi:molecular chaperone GrpE
MTTDESVSKNKKPAQPTAETAETDAVRETPVAESTTTADAEPVELQTESTKQTNSKEATDTEVSVEEITATPSVEELTRLLTEATLKAQTNWDNLLRKQAESDNLQKRMERELDNARKYALEKFATQLLAVKDSMELGIEAATKPETTLDSVREGIDLTLKMLTDTMAKFGIQEINPIEEKFNPQWHEAMAMQPVPNVEEGTVLHVHQKGYQLNERLLRPARVVVAKAIQAEKPLENQG